MKKKIAVLNLLILVAILTLSLVWEFVLEENMLIPTTPGTGEPPGVKLEYTLTTFVFSAMALFLSGWMILKLYLSRSKSEKSLNDNRQMLAEAEEIANLGGWEWHPATNTLIWSDQLFRQFGLQPNEITPTYEYFIHRVHPDDKARVTDRIALALKNETVFEAEFRITGEDRAARTLRARAKVYRDNSGATVRMAGTTMDVTAQKNREDEVTLLNSLIDRSHDAFYVIDPATGRFSYVNETACGNLGYTEEELLSMGVTDIQARLPDKSSWNRHVEHLRESGFMLLHGEHRRKNGSSFPVEVSIQYVEREDRDYIVAVGRDITERKKAETLTTRMGRILENAANEIYIFDAQTLLFTQANYGALQNIGYSLEELTRLTPLDIKPEIGLKQFMAMAKPLRTGEQEHISFHGTHKRKDGSTYPVDVRLHYSPNETPPVYVAIILDITERRRTEERLKESELKYRALVEQSPYLTYIASYEEPYGTTYISPQIEAMLGFTPKEWMSDPDLWARRVHPDDIERVRGEMDASRGGGHPFESEYRIRSKAENILWIHDRSQMVTDASGKPLFVHGIMQDISEKKTLQQQLIHAEKLSSIGTFVAGVAHELNNPLTAILGFSKDLIETNGIPEHCRNRLDIIARESERTVGIVRNLLIFSRRHESGKTVVNAVEVIENTLSIHKHLLYTGSVDVQKHYAKKTLHVLADFNQMEQVFSNIILNAEKALKGTDTAGVLNIDVKEKSDRVVIAIENNGPPIPGDHLNRIFDPFFTTKGAEGTGLGMYVAYGIVADHGGSITVENKDGKGVRFTVSLPVATPVREEPKTQAVSKLPDGLNVLVVEDDEFIRVWLNDIFLKEGAFMQFAAHGGEAIELMRESEFDLVLLDLLMPEMDGFAFGKWLKEQNPHYLKKLVVITGAIDRDVTDFCNEYRCRYILKPFTTEDIFETVNKVII